MELENILKKFKGVVDEPQESKLDKLNEQFGEIAKELLYGGYFLVEKKRKIYLDDIEFYYHEEDEIMKCPCDYDIDNPPKGLLKDPIMYHTNDHEWNIEGKELPYFKLGRFNMHVSGVDVTFESPKQYRASFLIRGFHVVDEYGHIHKTDSHSTHIFDEMFYMGVPLGESIDIQWKDTPLPEDHNCTIITCPRVNVATKYRFVLNKDGRKGHYEKDEENPKPEKLDTNVYFRSSDKVYKLSQKRLWRYKKK